MAATPGSLESEVKAVASKLRPISNQRWQQIAGELSNEIYTIVRGDTLYDISTRLFGDGNYWPKIWAVNNKRILNPHLIYPGKRIAFSSGSLNQLPGMDLAANSVLDSEGQGYMDLLPKEKTVQSKEWKELPRQRWEQVRIDLPPNIDPDGFDRNNKVTFAHGTGFALQAFPAQEEVVSLGVIEKAKQASEILSLGNIVFIRANEILTDGATYSVTGKPEEVISEDRRRQAFSYVNLATVKILDQTEENLYAAKVIDAYEPFRRGSIIVPLLERINLPPLREASLEQEANLVVIPQLSTYTTSQHKQVFVDVGNDDGIDVGNVFRSYQETDPSTGEEIGRQKSISNAHFLIVKTYPTYSVAQVITSNEPIETGQRLYSLTDLSEFRKNQGLREKTIDGSAEEDFFGEDENAFFEEATGLEPELSVGDDLDALDSGDELTDAEKRELRQLEKWQESDSAESEVFDFESSDEALTAPSPGEGEFKDEFFEDDEFSFDSDLEEGLGDEQLTEQPLEDDFFEADDSFQNSEFDSTSESQEGSAEFSDDQILDLDDTDLEISDEFES